jgi:uncharacterized protein (DUF433 family)
VARSERHDSLKGRKDLQNGGQGSSQLRKVPLWAPQVREDAMWVRLQSWQTQQLQRLTQLQPERAETILNTLWAACPTLLGELAISAVDQETLSVDACADLLAISTHEVEQRLIAFRKYSITIERAVVEEGCRHGARLAEGQVAVWEVVREYRKLGSVEALKESFPGLSEGELAAAFIYAEQHPSEVEEKILAYENMLARKKSEYPFMK